MLNEWQEFLDYTGSVTYTAARKNDTTYLGRFTFDTLLDFEGLARVLTILARGYLFHEADGSVLQGNPRDHIDYARRGLCAWCKSLKSVLNCHVSLGVAVFLSGTLHQAHSARRA